jgi:nitroreductase
VPLDWIDQLLEAATRAPSSHNSQPWRFAVITTSNVKEQLSVRMGARLRADRLREADRIAEIDRDVARSRERITSAPAIIVACLSTIDLNDYYERLMAIKAWRRRFKTYYWSRIRMDRRAGWPRRCIAPTWCEVLQLPDDWEAQALITLGYRRMQATPRAR